MNENSKAKDAPAPIDFAAKRKELLYRRLKKKPWRTPRVILRTEPDEVEGSETDLIDDP